MARRTVRLQSLHSFKHSPSSRWFSHLEAKRDDYSAFLSCGLLHLQNVKHEDSVAFAWLWTRNIDWRPWKGIRAPELIKNRSSGFHSPKKKLLISPRLWLQRSLVLGFQKVGRKMVWDFCLHWTHKKQIDLSGDNFAGKSVHLSFEARMGRFEWPTEGATNSKTIEAAGIEYFVQLNFSLLQFSQVITVLKRTMQLAYNI